MQAPIELPDPLAFAVEALAARGALVEPGEHDAIALLPPQLAFALGLGEEVRLVAAPADGAISCGLGAPLLDRLLGDERAHVPVGAARLDLDPPRPAQARAAGERFTLRNGLAEVVEVTAGEAIYLSAAYAWVAEADDRNEGLVGGVVVEAVNGATPDEHFAALIDPAHAPSRLVPLPGVPAAGWDAAARASCRRAARLVAPAVAAIAESVARRQRREYSRICEYFSALIHEARAPRRRIEPAAVEAKVGHFIAERDAKLRDLAARYRLRVRLVPAALLAITTKASLVTLRLRRRKLERILALRLPSGARSLDRPACEVCGGAATRPLLCDDQLHVLCEDCVPSAEGRPRCAACRAPRPAQRAP